MPGAGFRQRWQIDCHAPAVSPRQQRLAGGAIPRRRPGQGQRHDEGGIRNGLRQVRKRRVQITPNQPPDRDSGAGYGNATEGGTALMGVAPCSRCGYEHKASLRRCTAVIWKDDGHTTGSLLTDARGMPTAKRDNRILGLGGFSNGLLIGFAPI